MNEPLEMLSLQNDASRFYAMLRFEEAAQALRVVLKLRIVEELGDRRLSSEQFSQEFGFQPVATRTFAALLRVMHILEPTDDFAVTDLAKRCLSTDSLESRAPYLSLGADCETLVATLRGKAMDTPLYSVDDASCLMEDDHTEDVAEAVALGLASRARCFAGPLAAAVKSQLASEPKIIADLGAGSPYVGQALVKQYPNLEKVLLFDRRQGLKYARRMLDQPAGPIEFVEGNIFQSVPPAQLYCLSNTAHDWTPAEYSVIMENIRKSVMPNGAVVIHEPLLVTTWKTAEQWQHALWMACYALALLKLTGGKGTCYSLDEHDAITRAAGFQRIALPAPTADGCTSLVYTIL